MVQPDAVSFDVEQVQNVLVITPLHDMNWRDEFQRLADTQSIVIAAARMLAKDEVRYVLLDLKKTTYFGSVAVSFLSDLWKTTRASNAGFSLAGCSPVHSHALRLLQLDKIWRIDPSREEALSVITQQHQRL
ncbi:MAG: STAS domain-containing protein [Planctomycetales bacterium]|nr:STAS domain-containing protein [Planctomycetales bacterium]